MQSAKHRALISALILISTALVGCVHAGPTLTATPRSACSSLVGESLRADVPPVGLPPENATAGDLWVAFNGQTYQLGTANRFSRAKLEIIEACEKRDAAAVEHLTRKWWEVWK